MDYSKPLHKGKTRIFKMTSNRTRYQQAKFRIILGFAACSIFLFALAHPQISYVALLCFSALFKTQPIGRINLWARRLRSPLKVLGVTGALATGGALLIPAPASAAWDAAQDAAQSAFGEYIGESSGIDVITLLFTAVFLVLFLMIVGGLMAWGYRSFRNEEASASMTAFVVGTIIFIGGEVFSRLFFDGAIDGGGEEG